MKPGPAVPTILKELGKIKGASIGFNDRESFGVTFSLGVDGCGWGTVAWWPMHPMMAEQTAARLADLMRAAKVRKFSDLVGVPVEATFEGGCLRDWRILTEVI